MKHGTVSLVVGAVLASATFFGAYTGVGAHPPTDLLNAYPSREALGRAVVRALNRRDRKALGALRVTRGEHRHLLWEQLPEAGSMPWGMAWELMERNSRKGARMAVSDWGGQHLELLRIEVTDDPEEYEGFRLYMDSRLWVRRISDGQEGTIPVLDVLVERNGWWKLLDIEE